MKWPPEIFKRYRMVISPSQVVDAMACPRRWWFKSFMPRIENDAAKLGTTLHAVAERFLKADDRGLDTVTGAPVELYPAGWDADIDHQKANVIRTLITAGIETGFLARRPGRKIEQQMCIELWDNDLAAMIGVIDVLWDGGIEDHKTTKNLKYALTEQQLASDPKMLCYAHEFFRRRPEARKLTMRLSYYGTGKDRTLKAVSVDVLAEDVEKFWNETILPLAEEMLKIVQSYVAEEDWRSVPGPTREGACSDYGGCPFAPICCFVETPTKYRKRVEKILQTSKPKPMGVFSKKPTVLVQAQPTMHTPAAAAPPITPPGVTVAPLASTPPWAVPSCRACAGTGVGPKGAPCEACKRYREARGGPLPDDFDLSYTPTGKLRWTPKKGVGEDAGEVEVAPQPTVKPEAQPRQTLAPLPAPAPVPPAQTEAEVTEPATTEAPAVVEEQTEKKRRTKKPEPAATPKIESPKTSGLMLLVNASIFCGVQHDLPIDLATVLAAEGAKLAKASGKDSYFDLNAFDRRDAIAQAAPQIAADLAGKTVLANGDTPDLRSLVDALRPYATIVIQGLR